MPKPVDDKTKTVLKTYRWIILSLSVSFTVATLLVIPEMYLGRVKTKPDVEIGIIAFILLYMSLGNWCIWITTREFFTMSYIQKRIHRLILFFLSLFLFAFTVLTSFSSNPMAMGFHASVLAPFFLIIATFYLILWITMVRIKRIKATD